MSDIEKTLKERGDRYGSFFDHAIIAQNLQDTMRKCEGWDMLAPDQKQALTVISDKIARMLNGQPDYRDNWHDIVGYAKLVDDRLALAEKNPDPIAIDRIEPATDSENRTVRLHNYSKIKICMNCGSDDGSHKPECLA